MPKLLEVATLLPPARAAETVKTLNTSEEDGWSYSVDAPEGAQFARIKVFDEEGVFLGYL